jgi:hypothetical protein
MSLSWMILCEPDPLEAAVLFSFCLLETLCECIVVASSHLICQKHVILFLKLCSCVIFSYFYSTAIFTCYLPLDSRGQF